MAKTTATNNFNSFIILNIYGVLLLMLSRTAVSQIIPEIPIPGIPIPGVPIPFPSKLWTKSSTGDLQIRTNNSPYLSPQWNGLFQVVDPAEFVRQQQAFTNLYSVVPGSNYDGSIAVVKQNDRDNNDRNGNDNTTPQPEKKHYLVPCYFKVCNIAKK